MLENEFTLENSMDILVLHPESNPELITIPTNNNPFEYFFGKFNFFEGHGYGNYYFAFHRSGKRQGYAKNVSLGYNPYFSNIYGPIVFAYAQASINIDVAQKILEQYEIAKPLSDLRIFKNRKVFYLQYINESELIIDFPHAFVSPTYEDKQKYYIKNHEELSYAVFQLLSSYYGTYTYRFQTKYYWNPLEIGFESELNLIQFANFVCNEFEEEKVQCIEEIKLGIMSKQDACFHLSRINSLIKPIREELLNTIEIRK